MNQCRKSKNRFKCDGADCDYNPNKPGLCPHNDRGMCYFFMAITKADTNPEHYDIYQAHIAMRATSGEPEPCK